MYEKTYQARVLKEDIKLSNKRKNIFSWKRILISISILTLVLGIVYIIRLPKLQIDQINVVGVQVLDQQDVVTFVHEKLSGKKAWILPKSSSLLFNSSSLDKKIKNKFPRIESVNTKRVNARTIEISIKEFDAKYLWCTTEEVCYFADKQGFVYSIAPVFSGAAYPKLFTGVLLETLPFIGISYENLSLVNKFTQRLSDINIYPTEFHFVSERELKIKFLHNGYVSEIYIDPKKSIETSLEYLFSGIRTAPLSTSFRDSQKKLLYIDLRFPNKIVYKFE